MLHCLRVRLSRSGSRSVGGHCGPRCESGCESDVGCEDLGVHCVRVCEVDRADVRFLGRGRARAVGREQARGRAGNAVDRALDEVDAGLLVSELDLRGRLAQAGSEVGSEEPSSVAGSAAVAAAAGAARRSRARRRAESSSAVSSVAVTLACGGDVEEGEARRRCRRAWRARRHRRGRRARRRRGLHARRRSRGVKRLLNGRRAIGGLP